MIKGCTKKMVLLKDTGSDFFEEAYFILKTDSPFGALRSERDFVAEANRIIAESRTDGQRATPQSPRKRIGAAFFAGAACGIVLCVLTYIILHAVL